MTSEYRSAAAELTQSPTSSSTHPHLRLVSPADKQANTKDDPKYLAERGLKYACTDLGNADRFVEQHRGYLRFVVEKQAWSKLVDGRYRCATEGEVHECANQTVRSIYPESETCQKEQGREDLRKWAKASQSKGKIEAMIQLASRHIALEARQPDFDKDPFAINCTNGYVDLRTGKLHSHSPDALFSKLVPVAYNPSAQCPRFLKFLDEIFPGDPELIEWVQKAIGYSITGSTQEQILFIAYGTGANGKTTLFETLASVLGDYSQAASFETFLANDRTNIRALEGIAKLQGIRLAIASETDKNRSFNEGLLKRVTGGDTVAASHLYGDSFEFTPKFKLWFQANHLPTAKDGSEGFWRRIRVVPFMQTFPAATQDQTLRDTLDKEREGILAWCVEGATKWFTAVPHGATGSRLGQCETVKEAIAHYREEFDTLSRFLEEKVEPSEGSHIPARQLFDLYKGWCEDNGETQPLPETFFGQRMQERGYRKSRRASGNVYLGIRHKTSAPSQEPGWRPKSATEF